MQQPTAAESQRTTDKTPLDAARGPALEPPSRASLVEAIEAAATNDRTLFTLHTGEEAASLSTRDVLERGWHARNALLNAGARQGDRVPIALPTSLELIDALVGTMLLGAAAVPLATPLTFGSLDRYIERILDVIEDADARIIVTTERIRRALLERGSRAASLNTVLLPHQLDDARSLGSLTPSIDGRSLALLQYTSGTTGSPKGVMISHRALVANADAIAGALELRDDDIGASWLPAYHDMGLIGVLMTALYRPYSVHLTRPDAFIMRPARWLELIASTGATISAAPNFAYELAARRVDGRFCASLERWRVALNGAEPVRPATIARFEERFGPLGYRASATTPAYGLAEATLAVALQGHGDRWEKESIDGTQLADEGVAVASGDTNARLIVACGKPVARTAIRIRSGSQLVGDGHLGEVEVSSPSLMDGYFRRERASAEALASGWLRTGDLGYLRGGRLFVVGREKDVIIKGGRNLYPEDVERVAMEITGADGGVAAFAVADEETGTDALVVLVESLVKDTNERERLAREVRGSALSALEAKIDEVLICRFGSLPRTTSGKIQRGACRERYVRGELG